MSWAESPEWRPRNSPAVAGNLIGNSGGTRQPGRATKGLVGARDQQIEPPQRVEIARPDETHDPIDFGSVDREDMRHAGLARDRETPELGAGNQHGARTERDRLDDIGAAPDPAVD